MKGCNMNCVKYSLFTFNVIFVLMGLALIILGIIIETRGINNFANRSYGATAVLSIILGSCVTILAFFGSCGAWYEKTWKLAVYGVLLLILLVFQVALIVVTTIYREDLEELMRSNMKKSIAKETEDDKPMWTRMQTSWQCCGVDGASDFEDNNVPIPPSCCKEGSSKCSKANSFETGCYTQLKKFLDDSVYISAGFGGVVAFIEVAAAMAAFYLVWAIRSNNKGDIPSPKEMAKDT